MRAVRAALVTVATLATLAGASPWAAADEIADVAVAAPAAAPRLLLSVPVLALSSNSVAIQAERPLRPRLSAAVSVGVRDGADGDYQAITGAVGGELRFWLRAAPRGWFAGPRVELAATRMTTGDRSLGVTTTITEGVVGGYRLVLGSRVELTVLVGVALRHDLPSRIVPAMTRVTPLYGGTIGWVF